MIKKQKNSCTAFSSLSYLELKKQNYLKIKVWVKKIGLTRKN